MTKQVIKRAYETEKVTRTRAVTKFVKQKGSNALVRQNVEETVDGWMVYFPNKSSMFIDDEAELRRLGLHSPSGFIDMQTGEPVEATNVVSLKRELEQHQENVGRVVAASE